MRLMPRYCALLTALRFSFDLRTHAMAILQAGFQRRENRARIERLCIVYTDIEQVAQRLRHRLERLDLVFELQLFLDHQATHILAARVVLALEFEELAYFGKRKAAVLRMLDEVETTHRLFVVEP